MPRWFLMSLGVSCAAPALAPALHAQVPFNACLDRQGQPIPGIVDNNLGYAAAATSRGGHPVILWNRHNLAGTSNILQLFVYLHECAHHSLNHVYKSENRTVEDQADCWAIQLMVDGGMANGSHLAALTRELKHTRGDENHLGGDALLQSLRSCLAFRTDQAAWDTALTALTMAASSGFHDIQGARIPDAPSEVYETTQGTPGTYDCELLQPPAVRCMVFVARKEKAANKRFEDLNAIIHNWLSPDWTSTEPSPPPPGLARALLAQDGREGTVVVLGLTTDARVYFLVKPGSGM